MATFLNSAILDTALHTLVELGRHSATGPQVPLLCSMVFAILHGEESWIAPSPEASECA